MKLLTHFNYAIVSIHVQETMRLLKNRVMQTIGKIHTFRTTLSDLLENDEDLALMNLTKLKDKPSLYNIPLDSKLLASHEEIEILLESYLTDYNSLETKLVYLRTQMQNAEELVMLRLDTSRNQLLIVDNVISVVTAALAFGSFIGSIFGMNFDSNIWRDPNGFRSVTIITVIGMVIGTLVTIIYFQKTGIIPSKQTKTSRLQSLKIL
jgi:Mg2+ and Co2+ transporter CorA